MKNLKKILRKDLKKIIGGGHHLFPDGVRCCNDTGCEAGCFPPRSITCKKPGEWLATCWLDKPL